MENLQSNNSKYEKFKLAFLSFISIFLLAFAMLYGAFNAYRDYSQDLEQNNNISQTIKEKDVEVKKAVVDPFAVSLDNSGLFLASTEGYSYCLNLNNTLFVNGDADFYKITINCQVVVISHSDYSVNVAYQETFDLDLADNNNYFPSMVYNSNFSFNITPIQYQDTNFYSLRFRYYFENNDDDNTYFVYNLDTTNFEILNNSRPIFTNTIYITYPFNWVNSYSAIASGNSYDYGYSKGYNDGEEVGYNKGLIDGEIAGSDGVNTNNALRYIWSTIANAINSVLNIFDFEILPGLPMFAIISVPIIISILFFVLKVVKK